MKKGILTVIGVALIIGVPHIVAAQTVGDLVDGMKGLHGVLDKLYEDMLPECKKLSGVARGLAGFAALWYIASRVWKHLANAEPIDFYPLFRPFVLGFCILNFTAVLWMIKGVMQPIVTGTTAMVENSDIAVARLLKQKENALKETDKWQMYVGDQGGGNREKWYKYTYGDESEGFLDGIGNDVRFSLEKMGYNFRNSVKEVMSEVLQVLFQAAALCINTLRTFQLVVLSILGPLVFGLAVFDGFQHTLTVWLARYINIFLWLPVANILGSIIGKIQEKMIELDLKQIGEAGDTFFSSTDIGYIIFMIIGIVGYFTVPSVANYIVHAAGGGALQSKVTSRFSSMVNSATKTAENMGGAALNKTGQAVGMTADAFGDAAGSISRSMASQGTDSGYFKDKLSGNS